MGEHTWLNGAVIGSTASTDKNRLDTGTLGFSEIHNQADYKVEHQSIGLSTGGSIGSQFASNLANTMLAGGAVPWIADFIGHKSGLDNAEKIVAHAVVNAALAAAQGQNAAAGAAGAITGKLTGMIAEEIYGKKAGALTESEKETVSALAILASGSAGGLVGNSTQSAAYAVQTGKRVECNALASPDLGEFRTMTSETRGRG